MKKLKRKSSVEPLVDRGSPLPDLPDDLREKQEKIDARKQKSPSPVPPNTGERRLGSRNESKFANGSLKQKRKPVEEIVKRGMKDPLQIIQLIRERKDVGFLYMAAAVPRSSIEYNPYNLQ